jgi:site-specific recombinase XerD
VAKETARRSGKRLDPDLLTSAQVQALMGVCSRRSPTGIRNRAILCVAWRCGLRVSEITDLQLKDLNLDEGLLTIRHGKGDRSRVVAMDAGTVEVLGRWLDARTRLGVKRNAPVFSTLRGGRLCTSYLRHALPRIARKAGLDGVRVHMHQFRHLYAIELEREGATLSEIRDLLGHSSVSVTDRYLRRAGASRAIEFAKRRSWTAV